MAHSRDEWTQIEAERKLKRMRRQRAGMAAHIQLLRHELEHLRWGMATEMGVSDPKTLREDIVFWQGQMAQLNREMACLRRSSTRRYYEKAHEARQAARPQALSRSQARVQIYTLVQALSGEGN